MERKQKKIVQMKKNNRWKIVENENGEEEKEEDKNEKWGKVRWKRRRKEKKEKNGRETKEDRALEKKITGGEK